MRKTIFSVAILLASTLGITAAAQSPASTQTCNNTSECTNAGKDKMANRPNPFEGLNLTEKQKTELQAIAPARPDRKCDKAKDGKCDKSKVKADKNKDLTKAEKQAMRAERRKNMTQGRKDYLAKVKTILTPEQYVRFLENSYTNQAPQGGPRGKMAHNKGMKGKKGGKKNFTVSALSH